MNLMMNDFIQVEDFRIKKIYILGVVLLGALNKSLALKIFPILWVVSSFIQKLKVSYCYKCPRGDIRKFK